MNNHEFVTNGLRGGTPCGGELVVLGRKIRIGVGNSKRATFSQARGQCFRSLVMTVSPWSPMPTPRTLTRDYAQPIDTRSRHCNEYRHLLCATLPSSPAGRTVH